MKTLEVLFTPADFGALARRNLDDTVCVVFDVFRATSSMITALANGAQAVVPVEGIPEAIEARKRNPAVLLAGERDGLRIPAGLTGGTEFDLGNSPREFTRDRVSGRTIVMTTTNGTRALRACAHAWKVFAGSFLNLEATSRQVAAESPEHLLVLCSGTFDQAAYEDVLAAGALCDLLWDDFATGEISDSALMARRLFEGAGQHLPEAAAQSRNGRRLLSNPGLKEDVSFCLRQNVFQIAASLSADGAIKPVESA